MTLSDRTLPTRRRALGLFAVVALSSLAVACGHKDLWRAKAVTAEGVRITPNEVSVSHGKLFVDVLVVNETRGTLTVDRDAMTVVLEGHTVGRSSGTFTRHKPLAVPAGGVQSVKVDFAADGFEWADVDAARLDWNEAFALDGQPLGRIPGMELSPREVHAR